jgi:hypothetical protein
MLMSIAMPSAGSTGPWNSASRAPLWDATVLGDDRVARIDQRARTDHGTLTEPSLEIGLDCKAARNTECDLHKNISS